MPIDSANFADRFNTLGYACSIDVLQEQEVRELKVNFENLQNDIGKDSAQYSLHNVHTKYPWVLKLTTHQKVLAPLQEILGKDLIVLDSRFICKYPKDELQDDESVDKYVAWHQDVRYWGIEGDVVSVWLAVDDADLDNGCMVVIPGTHKSGILEHKTACEKGNMLTSNQEIPAHLYDASKSLPCPLKAGQMSLHHGHLVHGSEPNHSSRRRCGFVIRYVSTSAYPIDDPERPRKFDSTVLVSGEDNFGHFQDNSPGWFNWKN